jgi:lysophospholipase L1-like esterase
MKPMTRTSLAVLIVLALSAGCTAAAPTVAPTASPGLQVNVGPGQVADSSGSAINITGGRLTFDPPEVVKKSVEMVVPGNYVASWDVWQPWPTKWRDKRLAGAMKPGHDEEKTPILGGLYRQIAPESIKVTRLDGTKVFKVGEDYRLNADWALIGNIDGRLGTPGTMKNRKPVGDKLKVHYQLALQRLDLVQADATGKLSVKKGVSRIVCPQLPEPDAGAVAIAGVYIAPWQAGRHPDFADGVPGAKGDYVITAREINAIRPAAPVAPVNPKAVAKTLAKLRSGRETRIAFMGASITLGAEAPAWWANLWTEKNLAYPSRVIVALRKRFPRATVTPIDSFKGGTTTKFGLEKMDKDVVPKKPDLVLLAFGGNDVAGPIGKGPRNPPKQYKEDMRTLIRRAKEAGAEVMIVGIMQQFPWGEPARRWPAYRKVQLELGEEENIAVADVYTEWMNQATRGVPPFTQLHNWVNHPGKEGHGLFADVILRFFE